MKKYLDVKLILFKKLCKNKYIISDQSINLFDNLKKLPSRDENT